MEHIKVEKLKNALAGSRAVVRWIAILAFLLPAAAQASPYFSVTADRTFLPGEKISVHLYSRDVDAMEFRLYHVNDPALFFQNLRDVHGFGPVPTAKEQVDEPTLIERFHDWKRGVWHDIRFFFRNQFSDRARAQIREDLGNAHKGKVGSATMFAQVPVLNSKQLVARWRQEVPPRFFSARQDVPVEPLDKGVYVVEVTDGNLRAYTVLVVTELALVTKHAPGQLLLFSTNRKTGEPIPDTAVKILASRKEQTAIKTDSQGLSLVSLNSRNLEDTRIIGVHGKDVALVAPYFFNLSSNPGEEWTGYIYTDRPVYRPGHPVHFKAILRTRNGERYKVPSGTVVHATVTDSNNKQVFQTDAAVSQFGTIHGDFTLPPDAALGYYAITISNRGSADGGMSSGFNVEEYKKPEYIVRVTPDKPRILQGESATATIEAKYYFGEPVAGAQVKYVVHRETYWSPFLSDQEADGNDGGMQANAEGGEEFDGGGEQLSEQSGKLDENGRLKITVPTSLNKQKFDLRYRIEARITDEARREISGHNSVIATYGSFQTGVEADKYMYRVGETIQLTGMARDYDGKPVQTAMHADLVESRYSGGERDEKVLESRDGQTDSSGNWTFQFSAKDKASLIRVTAKTPEGREVEGRTWLWIAETGETVWDDESQQKVQIIADKKSYKAGDTANLLVMANVSGASLLVTTEGRTIQTKRVVKATGSQTMISVPITSDNEPNVYVSVAFVHNDTLYSGTKNLKVPADEQLLNVSIEPSQPQFRPGDPAKYTLIAKDANGKPVAGEFSLGVVDEAIYAIHPDATEEIHNFFYGQVYNRVAMESSFSFYFTGEAGTKPMILAHGSDGKTRLAQLKPSEPLVQPKIRKAFPDTALWLADIKTDQTGHAQASFTFPDSLTTWRATVRGITVDTKAGSAVERVIVRKNLMVRLATPRFFRQGDDVTVSTIVHNYLSSDKDAQVSLETKGLDLQDSGTRAAKVPTKGDQRQDWHVHAQNVRESSLVAKALTNEESDALELTLPVIPFGVKLADSKAGSISIATGQDQTTINLPGDPTTSAPTLKIDVSPSIAGSIFSALDYLTAYPYGCTEQTMSSFLPNIVVAQAMKDLKLQATIDTPELQKKISAGMERLYDFQHDDGGWGWWKEDDSQVFMTAYVVSGLAQAKQAGYEIKDEEQKKAIAWLKAQLAKHPNMVADLRSYVVYAMALNQATDSKMLSDAYGVKGKMAAEGLAMLGLALHAAGDDRAKAIAEEVEKKAEADASEAHWPSTYDYLLDFYGDASAESTAYALRLLSLTRPDSPLLSKAAFWLVNHRDNGYFWESTKQTAMLVFGLLEYMKISHELDADFDATVFVNDKQVSTKHFTRADSISSQLPRIYLDAGQLQQGANTVRVQKSGAGRLYWSARGEYYSAEKRLFQNNKFSLSITRDYYRMVPQKDNEKIVYDLQPLSGDIHSGDVLAVRLTVNGSPWRYLLVEDPIPAGAEFIQKDDSYELKQKNNWWGSWYTRREFHDDHAAFFQTYFDGHKEYIYLLKIVNPGKFQISPASVQPMYQPSILSTTDATTLEVKQ